MAAGSGPRFGPWTSLLQQTHMETRIYHTKKLCGNTSCCYARCERDFNVFFCICVRLLCFPLAIQLVRWINMAATVLHFHSPQFLNRIGITAYICVWYDAMFLQPSAWRCICDLYQQSPYIQGLNIVRDHSCSVVIRISYYTRSANYFVRHWHSKHLTIACFIVCIQQWPLE